MYEFAVSDIIIVAVISYLLGSINSAILVSKLTMGFDIREQGSGNAGLTNSYRCMGGNRTLVVLVGDILKAVIATLIGRMMIGPIGVLIAGAFTIVGHIFPLYFQFRGGKGVLVGAAMIAMFDLRIFAMVLAVFIIAVAATRWVSLGSILAAALFPVLTGVFYGDAVLVVMTAAMALAVIVMHRKNIGRILRGEENKFSLHSSKK